MELFLRDGGEEQGSGVVEFLGDGDFLEDSGLGSDAGWVVRRQKVSALKFIVVGVGDRGHLGGLGGEGVGGWVNG